MTGIIAIYVIYNPEMPTLCNSLKTVLDEVDCIWVSDNSKEKHSFDNYDGKIIYKHIPSNKGIAFAQNLGIRYAIEQNYEYIVFFDQDSSFPNGFLKKLRAEFNMLENELPGVYGFGPSAINRDSGSVLNKKSIEYSICIKNKYYNKVRELMCSSSIIKTDLFKEVGLMDETLFIDGVDFEICWRAKKEINAKFYISNDCVLTHQLGEGDKKIFGRNTHIPTPFRVYYQIRNSIVLSKRNYVPLKWKIQELTKTLIKIFLFPLILTPHFLYFKSVVRGVVYGFKD